MKVTIELEGIVCTVESKGESLDDALQLYRQALNGVGFIVVGELIINDE